MSKPDHSISVGLQRRVYLHDCNHDTVLASLRIDSEFTTEDAKKVLRGAKVSNKSPRGHWTGYMNREGTTNLSSGLHVPDEPQKQTDLQWARGTDTITSNAKQHNSDKEE